MKQQSKPVDCRRTWGFRFSIVDAAVLLVTAIGTPWLVPAFVVLHFFLFCNVFRIRRAPELIWGLCFVLLAGLLAVAGRFDPSILMICQLPLTVILIAKDIRHPNYHGVFADRLNPRLDEYLSSGSDRNDFDQPDCAERL